MDSLKKYGKDILITEREEGILSKYNIDASSCSTIQEVLLLIDRYLNNFEMSDDEYEELDYVASSLGERLYYMGYK